MLSGRGNENGPAARCANRSGKIGNRQGLPAGVFRAAAVATAAATTAAATATATTSPAATAAASAIVVSSASAATAATATVIVATAAATATSAAITAAAAPRFAWFGGVDPQRAAPEFLAVEGLGCLCHLGGVGKRHETKASGTPGFPVRD